MGKIYATIRVKEVHAKGVKGCEEHNRRLYPEGKLPDNIDPSRVYLNTEWIVEGKATYKEAIAHRLEALEVKKPRKNAVLALEFVMGASPEFFEKTSMGASSYLSACVSFITHRYGLDNVLSINKHYDEETPHVHVLVAPITEKAVRWKNQRGEGESMGFRLCARDFTGNRKMLSKLQEDFYHYMHPIGQRAGVSFEHHTPAREQVKEYSQRTDYRMAEIIRLAKQAEQAVSMAQQLEFHRQLLEQKEKLDKELKEKREAERKAEYLRSKKEDLDQGQGRSRGMRM